MTIPFGVAPDHHPRFCISRLRPLLDAAHARLDGVVIECLNWAELIPRYDTPKTLFYLDPPYLGNESDYGKEAFGREQFDIMASILNDLKGAFILSINDHPEVRDLFAGFHFEEQRLSYSISRKGGTPKARELIISNVNDPTRLI